MIYQEKLNFVLKLQDLLSKNRNFVLVKIGETSHQTLERLRKELKKTKGFFKVTKNALFEKAINKIATKDKLFRDIKKTFLPLTETSALFILDKEWNKGLHVFYDFIKKETSLSFKFGLLDGKSYKSDELLRIAKLPAKDQLIAQIIGSFKSPTSHFVYSLKYNLTKLVYLLNEKSRKGR